MTTLLVPHDLVSATITAAVPVPPSGFYAQHSLLRTGSPGLEPRWEMDGIHFQSRLCASYHAIEIARCLDLGVAGAANNSVVTCPPEVAFKPYRIEVATENGPLGAESATWLADRLLLGLSQRLEALIWNPDASAAYPATATNIGLGGLASATAPTASGATGLLGAAENKILSAAAGAGTIHMAPSMAVALTADSLVQDGDILRTKATGSKVVIGNYPVNTMAAHVGEIDVYVSPSVYQDESFDRTKNKFWTRAWTDAMVAFNTCAAWTLTFV